MRIEIVLPVFNEAHVLRQSVQRVLEFVSQFSEYQWMLTIAENGSTDSTAEIAAELADDYEAVLAISIDGKGRGRALKHVWRHSPADFSMYMDIDLSTQLSAIPEALAALQAGNDLVVGSRFHRDSKVSRGVLRGITSRCYRCMARICLQSRCDDPQCGFKAIRVGTVSTLLDCVQSERWFFDTELLYLAELASMRIATIPITWVEDKDTRVRILPTTRELVFGLIRMRRSRSKLCKRLAV